MNYLANVVGVHPDSHSPLSLKIEAIAKARAAALIPAPVPLRGPAFNRERHKHAVWERRWRMASEVLVKAGIASPQVALQTILEIVADVASKHGLKSDDLLGPRRTKAFVLPRHEAMYRISVERRDLSFPQIGRMFRRDHTTVLHAIRQHAKRNGLSPARPST